MVAIPPKHERSADAAEEDAALHEDEEARAEVNAMSSESCFRFSAPASDDRL